MEFLDDRPFGNPEAAARKLLDAGRELVLAETGHSQIQNRHCLKSGA
jgi:hypothetical protein